MTGTNGETVTFKRWWLQMILGQLPWVISIIASAILLYGKIEAQIQVMQAWQQTMQQQIVSQDQDHKRELDKLDNRIERLLDGR